VSIAYLVLSHHQPALLARLVDRLLDRDAHVFVHVDRRAEIGPFQEALRALTNPWLRSNLHLAADRRKVAYFGFTPVEAILALMRQASEFSRFSYYSLLSGVDYPIKPGPEIHAFFEARDTEYLVYWLLTDRPSWQHKVEHYFLADYVPIRNLRRPRLGNFWKLRRSVAYLYWTSFFRYRDRLPKRRYPFADLRPYGGSAWWSLTHGCVRYVLDFVARRPDVVRFFRFTECPDELFFQTVVMNSPYAEKAANIEEYRRWSERTRPEEKTDESRLPESSFNLRYIDWTGPYGGERGYPYILDERDFEQLRDSPCLFARKFDARRSASLLDRIDAELLGIDAA
jgi:hypothetical protein